MTWINGYPTEAGHYRIRYHGKDKVVREELVRIDREGTAFFADGIGYWLPKDARGFIESYEKVDSVE